MEVRKNLRNNGERRTGIQSRWDDVEHVCVHVGVDSPVGGSIVARCDEDRVPLSNSEGNQVYWILFHVSLYTQTLARAAERKKGDIRRRLR